MEKFGVEELPEDTKTASTRKLCPRCSTELRPVDETGVLLCPACGSKPFEAK